MESSYRSLLDRDISVSSEWIRALADQSLVYVNWFVSQTRRLILVEDLVDSLKVSLVEILICSISLSRNKQTFTGR